MGITSQNTVVLYPFCINSEEGSLREPSAHLSEAVGLAEAIGLNVVFTEVIKLSSIKPALYIGAGNVDKIKEIIADKSVALVVMDCQLSPMQQRNLEKAWNCKVIDRTALILEIFGERASTREGVLQVELAHLTYQKSRLVRSWTHLERQRGGAGFLGGPGEKQIEMDRRVISEKIVRIKKELEKVKRTRSLHRKSREKVPFPVVALVGYTNAGKSTLFNHITKAGVLAKDQLFATLDPTMRRISLPLGRQVILSDTVGFISELPTELVAAFRATLEEVLSADIILHIRDCVHPDSEAQKQDVYRVLKSLGVGDKIENNMIEVLNKIDLLDDTEKQAMLTSSQRKDDDVVALSAIEGTGVSNLLARIETKLGQSMIDFSIKIDSANGADIAYLYRIAEIVTRKDKGEYAIFHVRMDKSDIKKFKAYMKDKHKDD